MVMDTVSGTFPAFSACEVDVLGTLSMYALTLASESPSALLDWNNNYGDNPDKAVCFHCSNLPKHFFNEGVKMDFQQIIAGEQRPTIVARPGLSVGFLQPQPAQLQHLGVQMQMPPVMKGHLGVRTARLVDFARNIILRMAGRHQHARQDRNRLRPALDASGDGIANDGRGELQKTTFDNALRLVAAKEVH